MSSTILTKPLSVGALLLAEGQDSTRVLADALAEQDPGRVLSGALRQLSDAGRAAVVDETAAAINGLLDLDLGELIVTGWRKHADLRAAAARTAAAPGATEVVELAAHRIVATQDLSVDLLVEEVRVASLQLGLRVEFLVRALVATVQQGRLTAWRPGSCLVTVTLAAEGQRLLSRSEQLDLPMVIRAGNDAPALLR
jgi:hypothetical protein